MTLCDQRGVGAAAAVIVQPAPPRRAQHRPRSGVNLVAVCETIAGIRHTCVPEAAHPWAGFRHRRRTGIPNVIP